VRLVFKVNTETLVQIVQSEIKSTQNYHQQKTKSRVFSKLVYFQGYFATIRTKTELRLHSTHNSQIVCC